MLPPQDAVGHPRQDSSRRTVQMRLGHPIEYQTGPGGTKDSRKASHGYDCAGQIADTTGGNHLHVKPPPLALLRPGPRFKEHEIELMSARPRSVERHLKHLLGTAEAAPPRNGYEDAHGPDHYIGDTLAEMKQSNPEPRAREHVALAHDYLLVMRGAERTFAAMAELYPQSPIFTLLYDESGTNGRFAGRAITTSGLQRLGVSQANFRRMLPLYPFAAERLKPPPCDVVLSSISAFAHGLLVP